MNTNPVSLYLVICALMLMVMFLAFCLMIVNARLSVVKSFLELDPKSSLSCVEGRIKELMAKENALHYVMQEMKTSGAETITRERLRQLSVEKFTLSHDDRYIKGELVWAAHEYLFMAGVQISGNYTVNEWKESWPESGGVPSNWPKTWDKSWWKPSDDPIRNLAKAGALIAAEIDRLDRVSMKEIAASITVSPETMKLTGGWPGHDDATAFQPKSLVERIEEQMGIPEKMEGTDHGRDTDPKGS